MNSSLQAGGNKKNKNNHNLTKNFINDYIGMILLQGKINKVKILKANLLKFIVLLTIQCRFIFGKDI